MLTPKSKNFQRGFFYYFSFRAFCAFENFFLAATFFFNGRRSSTIVLPWSSFQRWFANKPIGYSNGRFPVAAATFKGSLMLRYLFIRYLEMAIFFIIYDHGNLFSVEKSKWWWNVYCHIIRYTFLIPGEFGCSEEITAIIAMLQIQEVFVFPLGSRHKAVSFIHHFENATGHQKTNIFPNFCRN